MTSPVHTDSYLPVDPDLQIVHDNGDHIDNTKCGLRCTWVKHILLIPITYDWCSDCYPTEEVP
jgi:hypothetical protein